MIHMIHVFDLSIGRSFCITLPVNMVKPGKIRYYCSDKAADTTRILWCIGVSWSFTMGLGDEGDPKVILSTQVCLRTMAPETRDGKREPICIYRDPRPSYLQGGYVVAG